MDDGTLNMERYPTEAVNIVIHWFYQAKEVRPYLTSQPRSNVVDYLIAGLSEDQHLAGVEEDTIGWKTVSRMILCSN